LGGGGGGGGGGGDQWQRDRQWGFAKVTEIVLVFLGLIRARRSGRFHRVLIFPHGLGKTKICTPHVFDRRGVRRTREERRVIRGHLRRWRRREVAEVVVVHILNARATPPESQAAATSVVSESVSTDERLPAREIGIIQFWRAPVCVVLGFRATPARAGLGRPRPV
jgi:hypothetical protein